MTRSNPNPNPDPNPDPAQVRCRSSAARPSSTPPPPSAAAGPRSCPPCSTPWRHYRQARHLVITRYSAPIAPLLPHRSPSCPIAPRRLESSQDFWEQVSAASQPVTPPLVRYLSTHPLTYRRAYAPTKRRCLHSAMLPSYHPLSGAQASAYDALAAPILAGISTGDDPLQVEGGRADPQPQP